MNGWLMYHKKDAQENQSYIDWFLEEAKKQNVDIKLVFREDLAVGIVHNHYEMYINGKYQSFPNFIVNRTIEPVLQEFFTACRIPTFNDAETAAIANHKMKTHLELNKLDIPMMPTFFIHGNALPSVAPLAYPVIVKAVAGRGGKQVQLIEDDGAWKTFIQHPLNEEFIVQSTNVQLGKDVRVFIIGTEIIAAVLRHNPNDFRANYKLGGTATLYSLSQAEITMIKRIIKRFHFGLVGIDFLIDQSGKLIFNEIEDVVGSRILSEVSDINLLERYIHFIKKSIHNE